VAVPPLSAPRKAVSCASQMTSARSLSTSATVTSWRTLKARR
jgi:hypothetical protein